MSKRQKELEFMPLQIENKNIGYYEQIKPLIIEEKKKPETLEKFEFPVDFESSTDQINKTGMTFETTIEMKQKFLPKEGLNISSVQEGSFERREEKKEKEHREPEDFEQEPGQSEHPGLCLGDFIEAGKKDLKKKKGKTRKGRETKEEKKELKEFLEPMSVAKLYDLNQNLAKETKTEPKKVEETLMELEEEIGSLPSERREEQGEEQKEPLPELQLSVLEKKVCNFIFLQVLVFFGKHIIIIIP